MTYWSQNYYSKFTNLVTYIQNTKKHLAKLFSNAAISFFQFPNNPNSLRKRLPKNQFSTNTLLSTLHHPAFIRYLKEK